MELKLFFTIASGEEEEMSVLVQAAHVVCLCYVLGHAVTPVCHTVQWSCSLLLFSTWGNENTNLLQMLQTENHSSNLLTVFYLER